MMACLDLVLHHLDRLIVFAALTDSEYSGLFKSAIKSVIDFFIVFGVELLEV